MPYPAQESIMLTVLGKDSCSANVNVSLDSSGPLVYPCESEQCPNGPYADNSEIAVAVLTGLLILLTLLLITWMIRMRKEITVRSFEYCLVFSIGSIFILVAVLTWPLNESNRTCLVKPAFIALGSGLMIGMFVARVYKIWKNFVWLESKPFSVIQRVSNSRLNKLDLALVVSTVFLVEIGFLIVLYAACKFRPRCECRELVGTRNIGNKYYSSCFLDAGYGIALFGVNAIPLVAALFFSFNIWRELERSKRRGSGLLLNIPQKEIDDFKPIIISSALILVIFLVVAVLAVKKNILIDSARSRKEYYVCRSLLVMFTVGIPVGALFWRRYKLISRRQTVEDSSSQKALEEEQPVEKVSPTDIAYV